MSSRKKTLSGCGSALAICLRIHGNAIALRIDSQSHHRTFTFAVSEAGGWCALVACNRLVCVRVIPHCPSIYSIYPSPGGARLVPRCPPRATHPRTLRAQRRSAPRPHRDSARPRRLTMPLGVLRALRLRLSMTSARPRRVRRTLQLSAASHVGDDDARCHRATPRRVHIPRQLQL